MADEDRWRQQRADELFGDDPVPGFVRDARAAPPPGRRTRVVPPVAPPVAPQSEAAVMPEAIPSEPDTRIGGVQPARPARPAVAASRRGTPMKARGALIAAALLVAAGGGWLARGNFTVPSALRVAAPSSTAAVRPQRSTPPSAALPSVAVPAAPAASANLVAPSPAITPADTVIPGSPVPARIQADAPKTIRKPETSLGESRRTRGIAQNARRTSYLCRTNHGVVTRLICSDPYLGSLDRRLTARFAELDQHAAPSAILPLHRSQTRFLNRRQSCRSAVCVARLYRQRLAALGVAAPLR